MRLGDIIQTDEDVLDYDTEFYRWLRDGDTIASAVGRIDDYTAKDNTDLLVVTNVTNTSDTVKAWLSGGTNGDVAKLTIIATTVGGRSVEVYYNVRIKDR